MSGVLNEQSFVPLQALGPEDVVRGALHQMRNLVENASIGKDIEKRVAIGAQAYFMARLLQEGYLESEEQFFEKGFSQLCRKMWNRVLDDETGETVLARTVNQMSQQSIEAGLEYAYQTFLTEVAPEKEPHEVL